jgi:adenylate cyclase
LNSIFSPFDRLTEKYGLEKIKTIGDAYMAAAGIPDACDDHAERAANMALEMRSIINEFGMTHDSEVSVRIGINSGSIIAGVIGV